MAFQKLGQFAGSALRDGAYIKADRILSGVLTSKQLIIAGGDTGVIRSANYAPGSAGWAILGSGDAEFNDVTVRGDIISGNWDGTEPVDLSSIDTGATAGFALDSSNGTAQFTNSIFAGGIGFMDVQNNNTQVGAIGGSNDELLVAGIGSRNVRIAALSGGNVEITAGDEINLTPNNASLTIGPSTGFGLFQLFLQHGGSLVSKMRIIGDQVDIPGIANNTTGNSANVHVVTATGRLHRSTSALKYKSRVTTNIDYLADIELTPAKYYRKDDKRWQYGFIADELAKQDKLLGIYGEDGEVEDYDTRHVLAVMAAKINRLEAALNKA